MLVNLPSHLSARIVTSSSWGTREGCPLAISYFEFVKWTLNDHIDGYIGLLRFGQSRLEPASSPSLMRPMGPGCSDAFARISWISRWPVGHGRRTPLFGLRRESVSQGR